MSFLNTSRLRPLYRAAQVRELDQRTIAAGIDGFALMQRAASSAWHAFRARWPHVRSVSVVCGRGNNGGDGHVFAALAAQSGLTVQRMVTAPLEEVGGDAAKADELATAAGVGCETWHPGSVFDGEVIVDALLGTGLRGPVKGELCQIIEAVNLACKPVLAIDIPSGVEADTGAVLACAVKSDCTLTFIGDKIGLHTGDAPEYTGDIIYRPLGTHPQTFRDISPSAWLLDECLLEDAFSPRQRIAHKGTMGHLLVLGGAPGLGGAALIASQAAKRLGAGKVSLATAPEHVIASLVRCPEVMAHSVRGVSDLGELTDQSDTWVVGPGLGQGAWGQAMLQSALQAACPLVVDADALNLLAQYWPGHQRDDWVLTPHPGEAARLLDITPAAVQKDRPAAVQALQKRYGGSVILKGAGTLVAGPSGLVVCPYGNPGMASGGMGDALSGMIGALLAQGYSTEHSAWLATLVHALAADKAAEEQGERGLLASDLACYARQMINP